MHGPTNILFLEWLSQPKTLDFLQKELSLLDASLAEQFQEVVKLLPFKPAPVKVDSKMDLEIVPKFYFPFGKPSSSMIDYKSLEKLYSPCMNAKDFVQITKAFGLPKYLNAVFHSRVASKDFSLVVQFWKELNEKYHDEQSRLFLLLSSNGQYITPQDIQVCVEDVTLNHPGLEFLSSLPVFQNRYIETVVCRLFYAKPRNWNKKMTLGEFKKSGFTEIIKNLEKVDDINATLDIFSYQHFYVIYCKFWELDYDHDMIIDASSLAQYDQGSMTDAILDRVIQGYGKPPSLGKDSKQMSYEDFIWFILSVEDKMTPQAIEYWFRCIDLDGDGCFSLYEMQHFYRDQLRQMQLYTMNDVWSFEDFACSLIDLIKPAQPNVIRLSDLKKCRSSFMFFDMLFDLRKYEHQMRRIDPAFREEDDVYVMVEGEKIKLEGFEKFAAKTYDILSREENQEDDFTDQVFLDWEPTSDSSWETS